MNRALFAVLLTAGAGASIVRAGSVCQAWSEGESVGVLDSALVPEASGLVASRAKGRLYHVNDSGRGPFLYSSDLRGGDLRRLRLTGVTQVVDPEALAMGELGGEPTIIVGDIGDNLLRRQSIDFLAVRESEITSDKAPVFATVSARFPDGPHNVEALVMSPDGALYLFTKSWTQQGPAPAPSQVYRLRSSVWDRHDRAPAVLDHIGEIDFTALATRERAMFSDVVTDASLSADGKRLLVLTYGYAWELSLDLASGEIPPAADLVRGHDYHVIRLKPMLGKETIAYLPGDRSFLYGKEWKPDSKPSELIRVTCLEE